ncbi:hypothetical protein [Marinoscillum furvescens]|uniref:hypothetical protein n=1 Tax=Marinoscillum furvescens TaxID=1026 RepID=UPI001474957E|nr:hypothetical protein [Marinoscillum furvescens]
MEKQKQKISKSTGAEHLKQKDFFQIVRSSPKRKVFGVEGLEVMLKKAGKDI